MKLHLIDGTYELFRAHFGAPSSTAPDGREVGAARGFLRSLLNFARGDDVTHVGVAFDHVIESFRNDLFGSYKTGEGLDPVLLAQFPIAEQIAESLGFTVWPMIEFEADDALATAAARWRSEFDQVLICSPDKDLAQCVQDDRVILVDRRRSLTIDATGVREKWGVDPASIPDYLALVGDAADGVPGIPRWGAKSTAKVLHVYGHLDQIPDDEQRWTVKVTGAAALARNLRERRDDALLYRRLTTLRTDVPLEQDMAALRWSGVPRDRFTEVCEVLGDTRAAERVTRWAV